MSGNGSKAPKDATGSPSLAGTKDTKDAKDTKGHRMRRSSVSEALDAITMT